MKNLFITSTLRFPWNVNFNPNLCSALESKGISCHLPQRDTNQNATHEEIFQQNIDGIKNSEQVLCVAMNESVNLGGEVGFAFGINKRIIALKSKDHEIPLMLSYMISEVVEVEDMDNIEEYIDLLVGKIQK